MEDETKKTSLSDEFESFFNEDGELCFRMTLDVWEKLITPIELTPMLKHSPPPEFWDWILGDNDGTE